MMSVINIRIFKKLEKTLTPHKKITALMEAFDSLCQYHKQQLKLMFRFLTKEHKLCSKMCSRTEKSPIPVHTVLNQRHIVNGVLKSPYLNLPPVYVRLKDLRLTCPNIACGTVKLNAEEHANLQIKPSDLVSNGETRCSRRKNVCSGIFNCCDTPPSSKRRRICYSTVPLLSNQDGATEEVTGEKQLSALLQSDSHKTTLDFSLLPSKKISSVGILDKSINSLFEDLISCIAKDINGTDTKASPQKLCSIPKLIDTVQMGNLVDHLISKIKQNGCSFTQALNQYLKSTETKFSRTRFSKRQNKVAVWNSPALSLSRRQSLRIKRELFNLMETFSRAKSSSVNNSKKNSGEKLISNKEKTYGVLVVENYGNTPTVAATNLPRCNLTMHSNTVDYLCLPDNLVLSPTETNACEKEKVQRHIGCKTTVEDGVSSDHCRGGSEMSKKSVVSQGGYSVQHASNLFCKCTSKQFSGTIQDIQVCGVQPIVTTDISRNTHLKVVIERLKEPVLPANPRPIKTSATKGRLKRRYQSKRKQTSFVLRSGIANTTCSKNKVSLRPLQNKNNTGSIHVPQAESAKRKRTIPANHTRNPPVGNRLCSPVKIMFVSKIDSAEGIKYTLSSVCNSSNQKSKVNFLEISNEIDKAQGEERAAAAREQSEKQLGNEPMYFSSVRTRKVNGSTKEHCCKEVCVEKRKAGRSRHVGSPHLKQVRPEQKSPQLQDIGMQYTNKPNEPKGSNASPSRNKGAEHSKITVSIRFGKSTFKRHIFKMNPPSAEEINLKKSHTTHLLDSAQKIFSHGSNSVPSTRGFTLLHSETSVTHKPLPVTTKCTPPKEGGNRGDNTVTNHTFCQKINFYNTRSSRSSAKKYCQMLSQPNRDTGPSLRVLPSRKSFSTLSIRPSLLDKANTQGIDKNNEKQRASPLRNVVCLEDCDKSPVITSETSAGSVLQSNTVLKWWSTSTPSNSLLKDLDSRYEQIINTWQKSSRENQSSPIFQLRGHQQMRSPIQMLFEKKYDMNTISAWFMQTTETKSLSILPKANARSPLETSNPKGAKAGKTHASVISRNSRKRQKNTLLDTLNGHQRIAKFVQPENVGGNAKINELNCQENNFHSVTYTSKSVHLKFRHHRDILEDGNVDDVTVPEKHTSERKEKKTSAEPALKRISTSVNSMPGASRGPVSNFLARNEMAKQSVAYASGCTENFKSCKVFVTKCKDIGTTTPQGNVRSSKQRHVSNATELKKCTIQSNPKVGFSTEANSQARNSQIKALSLTLKTKNSLNKNPRRRASLRKSRGTLFTKASLASAWIFEKKNDRKRRKTTSGCRNASPKKPRLLSVIGKEENDYSKFLLGPLKPVRLPPTNGLSSKHGTYSLTPIRIPDSQKNKGLTAREH